MAARSGPSECESTGEQCGPTAPPFRAAAPRTPHSQDDGFLAEILKLGLDPFQGDLVIFIGRRRTKLRVCYADPTGLWLASKRFTIEGIKTRFKFLDDPSCNEITQAELALILEGTAYHISRTVKPYP